MGLNHNAPRYIVGIGYSVRFDELFSAKRSASIAPRNLRLQALAGKGRLNSRLAGETGSRDRRLS